MANLKQLAADAQLYDDDGCSNSIVRYTDHARSATIGCPLLAIDAWPSSPFVYITSYPELSTISTTSTQVIVPVSSLTCPPLNFNLELACPKPFLARRTSISGTALPLHQDERSFHVNIVLESHLTSPP